MIRKLFKKVADVFSPRSVYVVLAYSEDSEQVEEIIVMDSRDEALTTYTTLREIYGGRNCTLASRKINEIGYLVQRKRLLLKVTS